MKASAFTTELRMIDCMPLSVMFTAWRKQYADICQLELFFFSFSREKWASVVLFDLVNNVSILFS